VSGTATSQYNFGTPSVQGFTFSADDTTSTTLTPGDVLTVVAPGIEQGVIIFPTGTTLDFTAVAGNISSGGITVADSLAVPQANNGNVLPLPGGGTVTEYISFYFPAGVDGNYSGGVSDGQLEAIPSTGGFYTGSAADVSMTAVPEPSIMSLIGLPLAGLVLRRRRAV
jgi:hypothetical protein